MRLGAEPVELQNRERARAVAGLAIMEKLYGEFSILMPIRMVPGLMVPAAFFMPSEGLQNGME